MWTHPTLFFKERLVCVWRGEGGERENMHEAVEYEVSGAGFIPDFLGAGPHHHYLL